MAVLVNLIIHASGCNWWPKLEICMGSFFKVFAELFFAALAALYLTLVSG